MRGRRRSALLWGVVGLLTYAILAQAYLVFVGSLPVGVAGVAAVGVGIAVVVILVAYAFEHRLATKGRS